MQGVRMRRLGHRTVAGLAAALAMLTVSLTGASAAWAQNGGVAASVAPQFPPVATVGDQDVPASLVFTNQSTGEYADDNFNVTSIELTPSCGIKLGVGECPPGGEDPGVFVLSATGTGRAGTACAGQTFNITLIDPAEGRYSFIPTTPVTLGPTSTAAASCTVDFTFDVARAPSIDSDPGQTMPGPLQTDQYALVRLIDITPGPTEGQTGAGIGTDETTVLQATPAITTAVNDATITFGQSFTDTATITVPAGAPAPTGDVDFFVYGPNNATCTGAPFASSLNRPVGAGGTATSGTFTPTAPGTYRVIAVYSGDANYTPVSGACNDPGETVVVAPATPAIVTAVNDSTITIGQTFTDTATVTGPAGAATPTGTVDFFVYGPNNAPCTGAPVASSLNRPLNASGVAVSAVFTPGSAGTYRVIAVYSGDVNYTAVSGACNDPGETVVVSQATPVIATAVNDSTLTIGQSFTDTATITVPAGAPAPTGTVDFFVYGPNNATCTGTPFASSLNRPVGAGGTATSATFTPNAVGTYRVIAVYSGDVNYTAVSGACNDPGETVVVSQATPTIATAVNDATLTLGQSFTDTATITVPAGAPAPTGTVNFFVYAPGDTTCTGTPFATSLNRPVGAGGTATSATFTPNAAGTYRVIAVYSGDANYTAVSGLCNDPGETVVVSPATPTIATAVNDATLTLGESFTDTATITVPAGAPAPTGTVNFFVYAPGDTTCTGTPFASSLNRPVGAGGTATSGTFTPNAPGTYRVIATYSGDANYTSVSGMCNDANETVVVSQATPAIATAVNDATLTLGQSFTDTATITVPAGAPAPTGTVDFFVYAPGDTTCTGTPFAISPNRTVGAGGTATSSAFTPNAVGTYRVIARYSGDANYLPVSGACNDANETVVVSQATPAIATAVNDATLTLGQSFTDTATITVPAGAPAPTGTVDFFVFAPGDTTCTGTPFATSLNRPLVPVARRRPQRSRRTPWGRIA